MAISKKHQKLNKSLWRGIEPRSRADLTPKNSMTSSHTDHYTTKDGYLALLRMKILPLTLILYL